MPRARSEDRDEATRYMGSQLRRYRTRKGWSQERVAREAGISLATVWNIEHGERLPDFLTMFAIAEALEVDPSVFRQPPKRRRARRADIGYFQPTPIEQAKDKRKWFDLSLNGSGPAVVGGTA